MRKRLRKKLHIGEFKVLGFRVTGALAEDADPSDNLLNDLVDFVEARGLQFGGSIGSAKIYIYVEHDTGSCTDKDREAVGAWLGRRPEVTVVHMHPLEDAWYPDGPRRRS